MVGGRGKAAGGGENKVGSHEEIGDVGCGDVASDGLMAAGGAGVGEDSLVIEWVNPNQFENGFAEIRVGGAKISQMNMGFGGGGNASQIEGGGGVIGATDGNERAGVERGGREHVMMRWGRSAGSAVGADVDDRALENTV